MQMDPNLSSQYECIIKFRWSDTKLLEVTVVDSDYSTSAVWLLSSSKDLLGRIEWQNVLDSTAYGKGTGSTGNFLSFLQDILN